jgi:hypothetical protein
MALLIAMALFLGACSSDVIRTPKPHSDWSRGVRIGVASGLTQPSLLVEPGGTAHVAWTANTDPESGEIGYVMVSPSGSLETRTSFNIFEKHLREVHLRHDNGVVELCWNSDEGIRCSGIDPSQDLKPRTIIPTPPMIHAYDVEEGYEAWITSAGELYLEGPDQDRIQLSSNVTNVSLSVSKEDLLVVWMEERTQGETTAWLRARQEGRLREPVQIGRIPAGVLTGMRQVGLGAALWDQGMCAFYGVEFTRGLEGGTAYTEYVCLDKKTLDEDKANRLAFTIGDELNYVPYSSAFALRRLAQPEVRFSDYTYQPTTPLVRGEELAVVVSTPGQERNRVRQQIAVVILKNGEMVGFQPVSASRGNSFSPALGMDGQGNLYAAWLERTSISEIYLATTNPTAAASLNQHDAADIGVIVVGIVVEALTGLILLPFALLALLGGFLALGIAIWLSSLIGLNKVRDVVGFIAGLIVLWLGKIILLPQMTTFLPFSAFLPELSPTVALLWQLFWPLFVVGVSLLGSSAMIRRWELSSISVRFGLYGMIDLILTALIYGVILQGAT